MPEPANANPSDAAPAGGPSVQHTVAVDAAVLAEAYTRDRRSHDDGSAWTVVNMITSVDGAIAVDGLSGGLGNEADKAVFMALRRRADVVLVGAGTAMAERYRVPGAPDDAVAQRRARGQSDRPTIALVSGRLNIDPGAPLFEDPTYRPTIVTSAQADPARVDALGAVADVIVAGTERVDLAAGIAALAAEHGPVVLVEGGPTLNAQVISADLADELCITTSSLVVGGDGGRMLANGPSHEPRSFDIDRIATSQGLVFSRWLRHR